MKMTNLEKIDCAVTTTLELHPDYQEIMADILMKKILEEGDAISEEIIAGLGIQKNWLYRFPNTLSGGELQRFCIARALEKKHIFC